MIKEVEKFVGGTAAYLDETPLPDDESEVERMGWIPIKDVPALILLRKTLWDNPWLTGEQSEDPTAP